MMLRMVLECHAIRSIFHAINISVRISGEAIFDVPDNIAKDIYINNPVLPRLYKTYKDLVYFRLTIDKLDYYDLSFTPPLFEHYENTH